VFFATRRIDHANGSFAGVAIAPISLDYFDRSFGEVDVGPSGFIALMAGNGTILARRPRAFIAQRLLRAKMFSAPYDSSVAASYIEPSPDDGVRRLLAFHRLDRYPLVISVALAESDYLAAWRADSLANYLALAAGTALIGGLASALGTQIFKRKQTEEILARLPPFDVLTGMAHRRRFEEELEREWRRAARDRVPLGLLVIEIENLNAFNDSYGHEVGDDLLIAIAHSISANIVRPADVAARYSGLEFAVILVSERIRRALLALIAERKAMPNATVVVHVGAASTIPKTAESASTLVHAAVLAVRSAKSKR
jgi:diguanylate cyclase (GGDEF)-like protein